MQDYKSDLWGIDLKSNGKIRVGFFTDFFNALHLEKCDNFVTLKMDLSKKHMFEMPSGHPSCGKSYHPILLFFVSFKLLNFGNIDISHLYEPGTDLYNMYSEHLFAFAYVVLAEFYCSLGTTLFTGAQCMCSLNAL